MVCPSAVCATCCPWTAICCWVWRTEIMTIYKIFQSYHKGPFFLRKENNIFYDFLPHFYTREIFGSAVWPFPISYALGLREIMGITWVWPAVTAVWGCWMMICWVWPCWPCTCTACPPWIWICPGGTNCICAREHRERLVSCWHSFLLVLEY